MTKPRPHVSVIVPAYNAAGYIAASMASVLMQTERRLELIVVDDCSTDSTAEQIRGVMMSDPRIRIARTARNGGPSLARNTGLDLARGEWIALLDADDTLDPNRLTVLLDLAERHGADMAADNILLVQEGGAAAPSRMIPDELLPGEHHLSLAEFILRNVGTPQHPRVSYGFLKPIIRRDFLERHAIRYDEQVRFAEDFALYTQCLRLGARWWLTPGAMYNYLVRTNSLTEVQSAADLDRLRSHQRSLLKQEEVRSDPQLTHAIKTHLDVIDRDYYYRAFTDAVKDGQLCAAANTFFSGPRSVRMIIGESFRQTPMIVAKALRGGYRPFAQRSV